MSDKEAAITFAQALVDNDNRKGCDFCDTGYCRSNHRYNCLITHARIYLDKQDENNAE